MLKKVKPLPQKNPTYGILGDIHFPIFSHRRNFMSQVFHKNGKISLVIPKWES